MDDKIATWKRAFISARNEPHDLLSDRIEPVTAVSRSYRSAREFQACELLISYFLLHSVFQIVLRVKTVHKGRISRMVAVTYLPVIQNSFNVALWCGGWEAVSNRNLCSELNNTSIVLARCALMLPNFGNPFNISYRRWNNVLLIDQKGVRGWWVSVERVGRRGVWVVSKHKTSKLISRYKALFIHFSISKGEINIISWRKGIGVWSGGRDEGGGLDFKWKLDASKSTQNAVIIS